MAPAIIHIRRVAKGWADRRRAYEVIVDGNSRGSLKPGEELDIEVEPGRQEVYLKIDWGYSRMLDLELGSGAEARLECGPRNALGALYWITFGRKSYIKLESSM